MITSVKRTVDLELVTLRLENCFKAAAKNRLCINCRTDLLFRLILRLKIWMRRRIITIDSINSQRLRLNAVKQFITSVLELMKMLLYDENIVVVDDKTTLLFVMLGAMKGKLVGAKAMSSPCCCSSPIHPSYRSSD